MIISVPSSLNLSQRSRPSRVTCTSRSSSGEEVSLGFSLSSSVSSSPGESSHSDVLKRLVEGDDSVIPSSSSSPHTLDFSAVSKPLKTENRLSSKYTFGDALKRSLNSS